MKNAILVSAATLLAASLVSAAPAKIRVAASLPDLASIAASVGGDAVEAFSIARAGANPHFVEVLPSYMIRVAKAQVYVKVGLGLDQWADAIVEGSRNGSIRVVDASSGIRVLEKPTGKVDASMGDVHPDGNPHYWLDPENGIRVAANIRDALKAADPARAARYDAGYEAFRAESEGRIRALKARMAPLRGSAIVTYHSSWPYFADAFGLRVVGRVEPFPGIPPTARHLADLTATIKSEKVKVLIQEPYYPGKDADLLARTTGVRVFRFTPSCAGESAGDYLRHFDEMADALLKEVSP
ncbi:MAG TPA: metal ABC transporter substrate-binding protein [Fibrobacteria bacterium]|jgi:ABC-type Zn uptake system ZnuABC Zn-binding protein ZnuA|nr:metal ABC transporter substrate-binding protein [Fibrobacteria bacterium]